MVGIPDSAFRHAANNAAYIRRKKMADSDKWNKLLHTKIDPDAQEKIERLRSVLEWYADKVGDCRKMTPEGEEARMLLNADAGIRAKAVLKEVE